MDRLLPALCFVLGACEAAPPEDCLAMCADAAALYGGCIEQWGLSWPDVGYDDAQAYLHSCETWVWEAQLLLRGERAWLLETCAERQAAFAASDATCATYTDVDWDQIGASP